jgi:hypothetical protein
VGLTSKDPSIGNIDVLATTEAGIGIGTDTGIGTVTETLIGTISTPMTFLPHPTGLRPVALHPAVPVVRQNFSRDPRRAGSW